MRIGFGLCGSYCTYAAVLPVLEGVEDWTEQALHDRVMEAIPETGMKNGQVLWPLRVAMAGLPVSPGGAVELCAILGKEDAIARMKSALAAL